MKFRSERERRTVVWGGAAGVLLLWWSLFLQPSIRQIRANERDLPTMRRNVERARAIAGELAALQAAPPRPEGSGSVALEIDRIVRQEIGIPARHVKNIQDVGKGAQIKLGDIDGGTLMRLLHALETAGIRPDSADLRDLTGKQLWDVTITVSAPPAP